MVIVVDGFRQTHNQTARQIGSDKCTEAPDGPALLSVQVIQNRTEREQRLTVSDRNKQTDMQTDRRADRETYQIIQTDNNSVRRF